jgi:hypothetical protein
MFVTYVFEKSPELTRFWSYRPFNPERIAKMCSQDAIRSAFDELLEGKCPEEVRLQLLALIWAAWSVFGSARKDHYSRVVADRKAARAEAAKEVDKFYAELRAEFGVADLLKRRAGDPK